MVLIARNAGGLEKLQLEIQRAGGSAECWLIDMADLGAFKTRVETLPALDIRVNNIGTNKPQSFLNVDEATFDQVFNLNVKVNFFCAHLTSIETAYPVPDKLP